MHIKDVPQRGIPPYDVWTGKTNIDGSKKGGRPQRSRFPSWKEAILSIYDLTAEGKLITQEHINDSKGRVVFSVKSSKDLRILKKITQTE